MSGIQQNFAYGKSFGPPPPPAIGSAYGGGYYAGRIDVSGTLYNLVVAPKASGENTGRSWGSLGVSTGFTSLINGPTNSAGEAALGYQAAGFCEGLTIGGYSDWYLPASNEIEVLYYFLKPDTTANDTSVGANANAYSPEPVSTNYTSGSPARTSASAFQAGNSEAFGLVSNYWSSTEGNTNSTAWAKYFGNGAQNGNQDKNLSLYVRAVRRVPV